MRDSKSQINSYGIRSRQYNASKEEIERKAAIVNSQPQCENCKRYIPESSSKCPVCGHNQ